MKRLLLLMLTAPVAFAHPGRFEVSCSAPDVLRNGDPLQDPESCWIYTKLWALDEPMPAADDPGWELSVTIPNGSPSGYTGFYEHNDTLCVKAVYQREEGLFNISDPSSVECDKLCHSGGSNGYPGILDLRIANGADDAEESSGGDVSLTSSDLELVFDDGNQIVGLRFPSVDIGPGALINSAWVQFTVDENTSETTNLIISGELSGDAAAFTTADDGLSSRAKTVDQVEWNPPAWSPIGAAGTAQRTPDLAPIIEEIVNSPGWSRGNALVLLFEGSGKRVAVAENGEADAAPLLHIDYVGLTP